MPLLISLGPSFEAALGLLGDFDDEGGRVPRPEAFLDPPPTAPPAVPPPSPDLDEVDPEDATEVRAKLPPLRAPPDDEATRSAFPRYLMRYSRTPSER